MEDGIWISKDAYVDQSARVISPSFIGPRCVIQPGATIGPFASIERDCVIDCGTTITRSSILPRTCLAPGLLIEESVVNGVQLENLGWNVRLNLAPARLARSISARGRFARRERRDGSFDHTVTNTSGRSGAAMPAWVRVSL
jgi:carbonic anhydrase/acetyltransferase-like protein (isoleucine patch superfamily)